MNQQQIEATTDRVFSAVLRNDVTHYTRYEMQEAFRAAAIDCGVQNKTNGMGSIVTRCMSRCGFGS